MLDHAQALPPHSRRSVTGPGFLDGEMRPEQTQHLIAQPRRIAALAAPCGRVQTNLTHELGQGLPQFETAALGSCGLGDDPHQQQAGDAAIGVKVPPALTVGDNSQSQPAVLALPFRHVARVAMRQGHLHQGTGHESLVLFRRFAGGADGRPSLDQTQGCLVGDGHHGMPRP